MDQGIAATDVLVFRRLGAELQLLGGEGRGAGWGGIVTARLEDEPRVAATLRGSAIVRLTGAQPQRVIGPYWSRSAALVPIGDELVIFGSDEPLDVSDGVLARAATSIVVAAGPVSAEKLMADELELVHAVRALIEYKPLTVVATARHIAATAAAALSCELGAVLVPRRGRPDVAVVTRGWSRQPDDGQVREALLNIRERLRAGPLLEQDIADTDEAWQGIVARYVLPIGTDDPAVLVVAHAGEHARGFTGLCQRIGGALAEAAELLIAQALAREELQLDRDRLAAEVHRDALTGVGNRASWDEAVRIADARLARYGDRFTVVLLDADELKRVNDEHGHEIGDCLIKGLADALRQAGRTSDVIARLGGDEFAALLEGADDTGAAAFVERARRAADDFVCEREGVALRFSAGWAMATAERPLAQAIRLADERMYLQKRSARQDAR